MTKNNTKDEASAIGAKVKELRLLKGLTQEQLSEKIGIDTKKLSRIETGRSLPSIIVVKQLIKEIDLNIYDLLENLNKKTVEIPDNYYVQSCNILKSAKNKQEKACYLQALKHTQKCISLNNNNEQ